MVERSVALVAPEHLIEAAAVCRGALAGETERDWGVWAGELEWSCRRTADHLVDTMLFYAGQLATGTTERLPRVRDGDAARSVSELLAGVGTAAAILAEVARGAAPGTRAFHPAGMADAEGFLAMGCEEILIHTDDIARGLGVAFAAPAGLAGRVLARLFPWAPANIEPWDALRWASGRAALPGRERLGPDWYWHCAPLAEWDGTIKKRAVPPGWA